MGGASGHGGPSLSLVVVVGCCVGVLSAHYMCSLRVLLVLWFHVVEVVVIVLCCCCWVVVVMCHCPVCQQGRLGGERRNYLLGCPRINNNE